MSQQDDELMTPQQAARYLKVSTFTLNYWRTKHPAKLPFLKLGSLNKPGVPVRYRKADLDAFAAKGGL